jgi:hypothetical protein
MWVNTRLFQPVVADGVIRAPRGTKEYIDWWAEEANRCVNGYSVGGRRIAGIHYYYLNWNKIMATLRDPVTHEFRNDKRKGYRYPDFIDDDAQFYLEVEQNRIDGLGMGVHKGRRKGYSWKIGSLASHEFTFIPGSTTIIASYLSVYADDIFDKTYYQLNELRNTEFRKNLLPNRKHDYIKNVYIDGDGVECGTFSDLHAVSFHSNPDATIGKHASLVIFEEWGKWPNLIDSWMSTKDCFTQGDNTTGFFIGFGTSKKVASGQSNGAKKMFFNPSGYNLKSYPNKYRKSERSPKEIGYFVSAAVNFEGHVDVDGNSNSETATESIKKRREKFAGTSQYYEEVTMNPLDPEEAFLLSNDNGFNTEILNDAYLYTTTSPEHKAKIRRGRLEWKFKKGMDSFAKRPGHELFAIIEGVEFVDDPLGYCYMFEGPDKDFLDELGIPLDKIYASGADSVDFVIDDENEKAIEEMNKSKRSKCAYVMIKRFLDADHTGMLFNLYIDMRPNNPKDFYEATAKANYMFNAKMLFEHTNVGIMQWYTANGFKYMLKEKPITAYSNIKESHAANTVGLGSNIYINGYLDEKLGEYIEEYGLTIPFDEIISQCLGYNPADRRKFDLVVAAEMAVAHNLDNLMAKLNRNTDNRPSEKMPTWQTIGGVMQLVEGFNPH